LGIHQKPVVLVNVNAFSEPLRSLVDAAIKEGFIKEKNRSLVVFVDPPMFGAEDFDWGQAAVGALENWKPPGEGGLYTWAET